MGLNDRDYMKESAPPRRGASFLGQGSGGPAWPPVTKWILIVTVAVFAGQMFLPSIVENWGVLETRETLRGQVWRLVTSAFLHSRYDFTHILFNMLLFVGMGKVLETLYGSREMLLFYLSAALIASVAYIGLDLAVEGETPGALGASGAVMGVFMLFTCRFPKSIFHLFLAIPLQARWLLLGFVIYDLWPVIGELRGKDNDDNVAHIAHLGGLFFGWIYFKLGLRLEKFLPPKLKFGVPRQLPIRS